MASARLTDKAFTGKAFTGKADFRRSLRQTLLIINALLPMAVGLGGARVLEFCSNELNFFIQ